MSQSKSNHRKILAVVAHPEGDSLTWGIANQFSSAIAESGRADIHVVDLVGDAFSPTFGDMDHALYQGKTGTPDDVAKYQRLLDSSDALVVFFPVYWWSLPGVLKGWMDRVFTRGWAFDYLPDGSARGELGDLAIHLVAVAGVGEETYERYGYLEAMRTQLMHGILDFCGVTRSSFNLFFESEDAAGAAEHLERARKLGGEVLDTLELAPVESI
ncbi:NAD(P)H dehydrogenase (quinone) [Rhodococcus sp. LBL1]|jgi:NAD(P)H dehydrogenase (quinone)|nr:NAD(P)H dehydrogenase (quinone) [Rhodococcus sp. LBL1]MDH6685174.1 NAD(P)H dehydrogenase (quinone) [Rhodococcus sp. LBL2]